MNPIRIIDPEDLPKYQGQGSDDPSRFYVGLDLGQQNDYTAICVAQDANPYGDETMLDIRHLERFRHKLYPEVAEHVVTVMRAGAFRQSQGAELIVDATGVGPAVTDLLTRWNQPFTAVKIHGGDTETEGPDGVHRVPKRNLVSALQVLLQSGSLRIAKDLDLAEILRAELLNFRVKVNLRTAHDSYEAWREGDHDDLVLAAALACWGAKRGAHERIELW